VPPMRIVLPSSRQNRITRRDKSIHGEPSSTPKMLISILRRPRVDMASPHSDMMTLQPSLTNSGKLEAAHTDHRKKIGSGRQKNCDPALSPIKIRGRQAYSGWTSACFRCLGAVEICDRFWPYGKIAISRPGLD
jgi:hypothetical protein